MNKVILIGHVGADPEITTFQNNKKRALFNLATNEIYKDSDGNNQKLTEWHKIIAWDSQATLIEKHVRKGMKVMVNGPLKYVKKEVKDMTIVYTNIVCREIEFLSRATQQASDTDFDDYEME